MADSNSISSAPVPQHTLRNDEMKKVFDRFDANGDGKISSDELEGVLKALGSNPSSAELNRAMESIDTDRDGFISYQEFIAFWKSANSDDNGVADMRDAFDMYDVDKDGLISSVELQSVLQKLGDKYSVDECSKMISRVDADGDGSVNFSEFQKMMANGSFSVK